jgi:hypothetical protein
VETTASAGLIVEIYAVAAFSQFVNRAREDSFGMKFSVGDRQPRSQNHTDFPGFQKIFGNRAHNAA